jgi:C4-dicarboxylate-specific signal transduction histidine kinase
MVERRLRRREKPAERERYMRGDGVWIEVSDFPLENGHIITMGQDVTESERARSAADKSRSLLLRTLDSMSASLSLWDKDDRLRLYNQQFKVHCRAAGVHARPGLSFEDFIRKIAAAMGRSLGASEIESFVQQRLSRRRRKEHVQEFRLSTSRWYMATEFFASDGSVLTVGQDTTAIKEAKNSRREHEAALQRLNRRIALGEMAAALAHETSQPIAAVSNYITTAGRIVDKLKGSAGDGDLDRLAKIFERIQAQTGRANTILKNMGGFVQGEEDSRALVPPAELIETVIDLVQPQARVCSVYLATDVHPDCQPVWCNRIEIEQVLMNLAKNGIEAMANAPGDMRRLTVCAAPSDDGRVAFSVLDSGPGLVLENGEDPFEAFWTTKPDGLGMGLSISRKIVESHGGDLGFENAADGGTCFRFSLSTAPETPDATR